MNLISPFIKQLKLFGQKPPQHNSAVLVSSFASWLIVATGTLIGFLFIAPTYCVRMWNTGHYQFFPIVFIIIAVFLRGLSGELCKHEDEVRPAVSLMLAISLAIVLAFANLLYSGFLGVIAFILAIIFIIYIGFGSGGLKVSAPVIALLLLVIPLPLQMDEHLITKMQLWASEYASCFLDGVGILHYRHGVILQTFSKQFLAEEACGGVRSLFSSWTMVAIYGVGQGHRWWRILFNFGQTFAWVLLGNILRIATVIVFADFAPWIAEGWGHDLLGLFAFGFILLMAGLTDAAVFRIVENELYLSTYSKAIADIYHAEESPSILRFRLPLFPIGGKSRLAVLFGFTLLAGVSLRSAWVRSSFVSNGDIRLTGVAVAAYESVLPDTLAGFRRASFRHESRGPNYLWAQNSYHWEYSDDKLQATVSLDSPWDTWHNLDVCYSNVGWNTEPTFGIVLEANSVAGASPDSVSGGYFSHSELLMRRHRQWGVVVFSAIDRHGNSVPEPKTNDPLSFQGMLVILSSRLVDGLGLRGRYLHIITSDRLPIETVQMFAKSNRPLSDDEIDRFRQLFFEARREIVAWKRGETSRLSQIEHVIN